MIALLDDGDSFAGSLAQIFRMLGAPVQSHPAGEVTAEGLAALPLTGLVLAPGPGLPEDAGVRGQAVRRLAGQVPILGVGQGHLALAEAFGARLARLAGPVHGRASPVLHRGRGLFAGLDNPFAGGRYQALTVARDSLPPTLEVVAWTPDGGIMGLRHREHETWGVQFHPESILTGPGLRLVENFLTLCRQGKEATH